MSSQMTSHPLHILLLVSCLVMIATPYRDFKKWSRIDCTRYVYHPVCRGVAAKRSSIPSLSSSSSSSSLSSTSSSSSSSKLLRSLTEDLDRAGFLDKILLETPTAGDQDLPPVLKEENAQSPPQAIPFHPRPLHNAMEHGLRYKLQLLLKRLQTKEFDPQDTYRFYNNGIDNEST